MAKQEIAVGTRVLLGKEYPAKKYRGLSGQLILPEESGKYAEVMLDEVPKGESNPFYVFYKELEIVK